MSGLSMNEDKKIAALEGLINEMSAAMVELVEAVQGGGASAAEISTTLVEMLDLLAKRKDPAPQDLSVIADAIAKLQINVSAPQVTVKSNIDVKPTPIENIINVAPSSVQIVERAAQAPVDYEMRVTYDPQGRIESARMVAQPRKASA